MAQQVLDLAYRPRKWQEAAHLGIHSRRFSVLVVHRRAGKTLLIIMHLIHCALKKQCKNRPPARYAYIAPELKQAKDNCWGYLKNYAGKIPGTTINEAELHVTLPNGNRIRLYGANDPDALRGGYLDGVAMDEVAQLPEELWDDVIQPQLADYIGFAIFSGTPHGINLLSETYFKAIQRPDEWFSALYTVYQTQAISPDEIKRLEDPINCHPAKFAREWMCDFSAAVDNVLLTFDQVRTASKRHYTPDQFCFAGVVLGIDIARQGPDRSAAVLRQGVFMHKPWVWRIADNMELVAQIIQVIQQYSPDMIFIDVSGGHGNGVCDRLRQLGYPVIGVQFGGKPDDPSYQNKRTEMHWRLAEWVKNTGQIPDISELFQDLCAPTYKHDEKDRLCLETKDEMKKRGLPSNDLGDAAALTFSYPVPQRTRARVGFLGTIDAKDKPGTVMADYDPMEAMR